MSKRPRASSLRVMAAQLEFRVSDGSPLVEGELSLQLLSRKGHLFEDVNN